MPATLHSRDLVVNGVRSPVLIGGPALTQATREAVVFVHGNPDTGADWEPLMTPVAEFATVIAPDMPGFGGADKRADQDYTVAGYAAHLAGLIDQLGIERVHLVAHDFGGQFALHWATRHPEKVASVTLINTGVWFDYGWHRLARVWRTPVLGELLQRVANRTVARFILRHDNPGLPAAWVDRIADHMMPAGTKRAVLKLYRSTSRDDMHALIEPLRQQDYDALVVWGAADVYLPERLAVQQRRVFPRALIEFLPGVGHWAWLEQPDRVAEFVVPFLRDRVGNNFQNPK